MASTPTFIFRRLLGNPCSRSQSGGLVFGMIVGMAFMSILFIVVPGILVIFYRSPHVLATGQTRHPSPSWTDACPLPVLGKSPGLLVAGGRSPDVWLPLICETSLPFSGWAFSQMTPLLQSMMSLGWISCNSRTARKLQNMASRASL